MDFLLGFLLTIFLIPLVTGHAAKQFGRSFWTWFAIACLLPIFSILLLALLPNLKEKEEAKTR